MVDQRSNDRSGEQYHPQGKHFVGESALRMGVNIVAYVLGATEYGRFLGETAPLVGGDGRPGCGNVLGGKNPMTPCQRALAKAFDARQAAVAKKSDK